MSFGIKHFLGVLETRVMRGALVLVCLGLFSACGSESSSPVGSPEVQPPSEFKPEAAADRQEAETFEDAQAQLKDVPIIDKQAVIAYTTKNQRQGERFGERGGVVGLLPLDASSLTEAETAAVGQARAVLAEHLALPDVTAAELVEISAQQWPNSSLGCARPGEMSAQVITEGYKVVLVMAGLRHQVHTGRRGGRVCERLQGMLQAPRRALTMSALPQLQRQARADLAAQLGIPEGEITPGRVTPGRWPDASLGCPDPGVEYAQVETGGYFLPMIVSGRTVQYRTDGSRVVVCEGLEALKAQES